MYGVLGDCPALKSALCHIGHTGYWPCWYCEVKGKHVAKKRQYYYNENFVIRTPSSFLADSRLAASTKGGNVKGRLGVSAFHHILDIPLPGSCIADYLHVTLLRHGRTIFKQLYKAHLKPSQRTQFDLQLSQQRYPHFFNRKVRSITAPCLKWVVSSADLSKETSTLKIWILAINERDRSGDKWWFRRVAIYPKYDTRISIISHSRWLYFLVHLRCRFSIP